MLKNDRRALVVAAGAAHRAADYVLDRQPARGGDGRVIGRERERGEELDAGRDRGRDVAEGVDSPYVRRGACGAGGCGLGVEAAAVAWEGVVGAWLRRRRAADEVTTAAAAVVEL